MEEMYNFVSGYTGKTVVCVSKMLNDKITVGKEYKVVQESSFSVYVMADNGKVQSFSKSKFRIKEQVEMSVSISEDDLKDMSEEKKARVVLGMSYSDKDVICNKYCGLSCEKCPLHGYQVCPVL